MDEQYKIAKCVGGLGEKKSNGGTQYFQQDRVYYGDIALALPAQLPGGSYMYLLEEDENVNEDKKTIVIGEMDNSIDYTFESANRVYDTEGIAPAMNTCGGGGLQPKIIVEEIQDLTMQEDKIQSVAIRGRYTGENGETEQHLELGDSDVANYLTSVAKDSMVLETEQEYVGVKQATKSGVIACEIGGVADLSYPDSQFRRGRVQDQGRVSPTLTGSPGICRIEKNEMNNETKIIKVGQICNEGSEHGTVVSDEGLFPSLVAGTHGYANPHVYHRYRIRKITEREAYRLMDFSDEDFEKGRAVSSKTQMYRTAGNSIICNVLVALFGQMWEGKEDVYKEINNERRHSNT